MTAKGLVALIAAAALTGATLGIGHAQTPAARPQFEAAAKALGGLERIKAIKTIALVGYGMYAYQMGDGNITAFPTSPQKQTAANDLHRVYDLEHERFQQFERRNYLFPFAGADGHNYVPVDMRLDHDVAYDINPDGKAVRRPRLIGGSQHEDGIHMRRMLMLNNPVALVRAALDPTTKVTLAKPEGRSAVYNLVLKYGDKFSVGLDWVNHLPNFIRWANPRDNFGQITFTTSFTGWSDFSGVLLPLGYDIRLDWRNVDYTRIWVDGYTVDGQIPDLAAPAALASAPEPQLPPIKITAFPVAKGIWRLTPGGTAAIEFKDHITLLELGNSQRNAQAIIDFAKTLVPGKPVTQVIATHHHADHTAGIRAGMAEGLTIISRRNNEILFREMHDHPSPDFPDALQLHPKPFKYIPVDEHLQLKDDTRLIDLYWTRNNIHMADGLFAYVPAEKLMIEGDVATAAFDYQWWGDNFLDNVEHYKLQVDRLSPVHTISPTNPNVLTYAEVIELLKGGVQRVRERCAKELSTGHYMAGCPVQSKRF